MIVASLADEMTRLKLETAWLLSADRDFERPAEFTPRSPNQNDVRSRTQQGVCASSLRLRAGFAEDSFRRQSEREPLAQRAEAISNEIALQEAAFTAIGELLSTDLQVQLNTFETEQVNNPFAAAGALPRGWASNREQLLKMSGAAASTGAAAAAARHLRASFEALVQNRFDRAALDSLLMDINSMLDIATKIAEGL